MIFDRPDWLGLMVHLYGTEGGKKEKHRLAHLGHWVRRNGEGGEKV